MSRFFLALALLLALFSSTTAETLVTDNVGSGISLPTTGGNATNFITVLNSRVSTSPYHLYVTINERSSNSAPIEAFYISSYSAGIHNSTQVRFGNATLTSQHFSPTFAKDAGILGSYLRNSSSPNTASGTYTFTFNIPVLTTLKLNLTYTRSSTSKSQRFIVEQVELAIYNPLSSVVGDPQFVGLRGQSYQVHGMDGAVYNIISEESTQVNSRFDFLASGGDCPLITGTATASSSSKAVQPPAPECWLQPGSYVGEMGFQVLVDGVRHSALITAGTAKQGFASVHVDSQTLRIGDKVAYGEFSVVMQSSHLLSIYTESFEFQLTNADLFIAQKLRSRIALSELKAHGLIGQTHSTVTYPTSLRYIEGDVDDYLIGDNDIFGTDFVFNRFLA